MGTNFLNSIAIYCFTCVANDFVVLGPAYQMFLFVIALILFTNIALERNYFRFSYKSLYFKCRLYLSTTRKGASVLSLLPPSDFVVANVL